MVGMFERIKKSQKRTMESTKGIADAIFLYVILLTPKCLTTQRFVLIQLHAVIVEVDMFYVRAKMQKL